jgi:hypothetical protein
MLLEAFGEIVEKMLHIRGFIGRCLYHSTYSRAALAAVCFRLKLTQELLRKVNDSCVATADLHGERKKRC